MNQSASNFIVLKQHDASNFAKIIDHNKPYVKRNIKLNLISDNNTVNNPKLKNKAKQEIEKIDDLIRLKQANKKFLVRSIITEPHKENFLTPKNKINSINFEKTNPNAEINKQVSNQTWTGNEGKMIQNIKQEMDKILFKKKDELGDAIEKNVKIEDYERISFSKKIEDQNSIIEILKEENILLKKKIENLEKAEENVKLIDLKMTSLKELFCNEAREFLEFLRKLDITFSSISDPIDLNNIQIKIFFNNLKQNLQPIKTIIENNKGTLRNNKSENENLVKQIASLNRKFNEQVKKGSEYNKTSAKCTNENSRKNSILLVDKISNKSKKSQSPNKKITISFENAHSERFKKFDKNNKILLKF